MCHACAGRLVESIFRIARDQLIGATLLAFFQLGDTLDTDNRYAKFVSRVCTRFRWLGQRLACACVSEFSRN